MFMPIYASLFFYGALLHHPVAANVCQNNAECADNHYCAGSQCLEISHCNKAADCDNLANKFYSIMCVGSSTCVSGRCGKDCDAGNARYSATTCGHSQECEDTHYCAAGVCLPDLHCNEDVDCLNQFNSFVQVGCSGRLTCEDGICAKDCDGPCPTGVATTRCRSPGPCESSTCEGSVQCIENYCGGCHSIHLDAAGHRICGSETGTGEGKDFKIASPTPRDEGGSDLDDGSTIGYRSTPKQRSKKAKKVKKGKR